MDNYGTLYIVGTPIGNLSDFSPRGIEALEKVDYIAAEDTRVSKKLLTHFGIQKPMISYYKHNEHERGGEILVFLLDGKNVAVVSDAGMPCISDPGEHIVRLCHENNIRVEVIPCCNAAIAAIAISGISTQRFAFEGFLEAQKKQRKAHLEEIKPLKHTLVFYEAPHKLIDTLSDMFNALGDRNIALCRELTKIHEEVIRGTISEMLDYYETQSPRGEYVIVVEGNSETEAEKTLEECVEIARLLIEDGMKSSEACKKASSGTGFSKSDIYREICRE